MEYDDFVKIVKDLNKRVDELEKSMECFGKKQVSIQLAIDNFRPILEPILSDFAMKYGFDDFGGIPYHG